MAPTNDVYRRPLAKIVHTRENPWPGDGKSVCIKIQIFHYVQIFLQTGNNNKNTKWNRPTGEWYCYDISTNAQYHDDFIAVRCCDLVIFITQFMGVEQSIWLVVKEPNPDSSYYLYPISWSTIPSFISVRNGH